MHILVRAGKAVKLQYIQIYGISRLQSNYRASRGINQYSVVHTRHTRGRSSGDKKSFDVALIPVVRACSLTSRVDRIYIFYERIHFGELQKERVACWKAVGAYTQFRHVGICLNPKKKFFPNYHHMKHQTTRQIKSYLNKYKHFIDNHLQL